MREMLFAVLLTLAVTLAVPVQAQQAYVWDGSSLQQIRGTQGITCSNWAMWYFKRGASQTPGSQWGAAVGASANEVLNAYHESLKREEESNAINVQYHLRGPDQHLYENYLGPICVTKTAFDATPGSVQAIENAGKLAGRINSLIAQIRTILNGARAAVTTGYQGYYLQEGGKTQLEEYLERVERIAENVHKVQNALMQRLGPTMMQINGQINTITQELGRAEGNLPAIRKLVSPPPAAAASTAWIGKTQNVYYGFHTSFQEVPGGLSRTGTDHYGTSVVWDIQFSNLSGVSPPSLGVGEDAGTYYVLFTLKVPTAWSAGIPHPGLGFDNQQDAQDAYEYLKAQIR
jgi:hypothetical protein